MKYRLIVCLMMLGGIAANSQTQNKAQTEKYFSKGTFFLGFNSDLSFGYARPENQFILPSHLKPKIGYFISDRFSLGISYQGIGFGASAPPRSQLFHNGEVEANYYFFTHKNILLYSVTGLRFQQYSLYGNTQNKTSRLDLKLGLGFCYLFKKIPNLGLSIEAAHYFGPGMGARASKIPTLSIGFNFFFNTHKKKKTVPVQ